MNSESYIAETMRSENELINHAMNRAALIDVGIIKAVHGDGRVDVTTFDMSGTTPVILENIEVIGIGAPNSGITVGSGGLCLLFTPKHCIPTVNDAKIDIQALNFAKEGIKALPITTASNLMTRLVFDGSGTCSFQADKYVLQFTKDQLIYSQDEGLALSINGSKIGIFRQTDYSGVYQFDLSDKGLVWSFTNLNGDSRYETVFNNEGESIVTHVVPGQQEDTLLNKTYYKKDGTVIIQVKDKCTVQITPEGAISIDTDSTITATCSSLNVNNGNLEVV